MSHESDQEKKSSAPIEPGTVGAGVNVVYKVISFLKALVGLGHTYPLVEHFVQPIIHALPPVRLAISAIVNLWDSVSAIFFEKGKMSLRAGRIALSALAIAATVVGIVFPAIGLATLVVGAVLTLFKENMNLAQDIINYRKEQKELMEMKKELVNFKGDAGQREDLIKKINAQAEKVKEHGAHLNSKGWLLGLGIGSLVGAALSFSPIGWIILATMAAMGIGKAVVHAWPAIKQKFSNLKEKALKLFNPKSVSNEAPKETITNKAQVAPGPEHEHAHDHKKIHDSTLLMSHEFLHPKDALNHLEHSMSPEEKQQIKQGLQGVHTILDEIQATEAKEAVEQKITEHGQAEELVEKISTEMKYESVDIEEKVSHPKEAKEENEDREGEGATDLEAEDDTPPSAHL